MIESSMDFSLIQELKKLEKTTQKLEPDLSNRKEISCKTIDYVDRFIEELPSAPGYTTGICKNLRDLTIGEQGKPFEKLLAVLENEVDAIGINSASGAHLGYIPGGGIWASSIADMLAAATNRYSGIAYSSPGAVIIENQLIQWLCSVVGYPATAHGNLSSGGSIANLIAVKAARDFHKINASNVKKSVVYFTDQAHHCISKGLHITGLYEAVLRTIPMNNRYQMDVEALQKQMENDQTEGLNPFLVVATAGTTDTGAIDPLEEIADLCSRHEAWFHVDAAYGGFFMMVDEMQESFKGIERSDSVVMDPHKTLFIPYGSGVVLIRNREALLSSNAHKAAYMNDAYGLEEISPSDCGPELSKHFRGLRMWLPLHLHGLKPFRACLKEKLLLSQYFHQEIDKLGFEVGPYPKLSIALFRYPEEKNNTINQNLLEALHADGRVFFSSTTIGGKLWIRCAVVSFRTHLKEIKMALRMIQEVTSEVVRTR